ncbi:Histone acetyltransferase HAC1 [Apostasia shenzhenica]|uniref:histone acetyltransferase n=1 Tax=Apostasia shenzhenica TaxID=1088818 RepID=A0A2I0A163_9ASPA|nr:Histone acetyltransferase HAC1 [Apostasia shenzhenica]
MGAMVAEKASITPAKRRRPDREEYGFGVEFQSGFKHIDKQCKPNGHRLKVGVDSLAADNGPYTQAYSEASDTYRRGPIFHGNSTFTSVSQKMPSDSAWNPLLSSTSLINSLGEFCASQRYLPNEHHRVAAKFAGNLCGNMSGFPEYGTSFVPACSISNSSNITSLQHPLQIGGSLSQLLLGNACLNGRDETNYMQYMTYKKEKQGPLPFHNRAHGGLNPAQFCQVGGEYLGKEMFNFKPQGEITLDFDEAVHVKNGIQPPLPFKVDLHGSINGSTNRRSSIFESEVRRDCLEDIKGFLYIYEHTSGCIIDCGDLNCRRMKQILNHYLYFYCLGNHCGPSCTLHKKLLLHYVECYKSDCPICPPVKRRLYNLHKFNHCGNSSNMNYRTVVSEQHQQFTMHLKNVLLQSPCITRVSEAINLDHATLSPQMPISQSQEWQDTSTTTTDRLVLEGQHSLSFTLENNVRFSDHEVQSLDSVTDIQLEADNVVVEGEKSNILTPSSRPCENEVSDVASIRYAYPCSQQAFIQNQEVMTSQTLVEVGVKLEGKTYGSSLNENIIKSSEVDGHEKYLAGDILHNAKAFSLDQIEEAQKEHEEVPLTFPSAGEISKKEQVQTIEAVVKFTAEDSMLESFSHMNNDTCSNTKLVDVDMAIQSNEPVNPKEISEQGVWQSEFLLKNCQHEMEVEHATNSSFSLTGTKLIVDPKRAISLLYLFTPEKIMEHIGGLSQSSNQGNTKLEETKLLKVQEDVSCSLCGINKLLYRSPIRYCFACKRQINPHGIYYSVKNVVSIFSADESKSFCNQCYSSSGESIKFATERILKQHLQRKTNYAEADAIPEGLVQCDKCEAWQHKICALFNERLNKEKIDQNEYTCPVCCLYEIERGERKPLLQRMVIGARELPRTKLSDHIEQWLFRHLAEERHERAKALHKNIDEVPTAEDLVVRVVSSVDKIVEVKPTFRKVFGDKKYPFEFPYKSKAIMLYQIIESADVLLFAMYVQEYGSNCSDPNKRCVFISYIDSVKYFRPEIRAVTGEALRTFVYHEFMIGYLDYCKRRGFASCHIWACPPLKHDDYILYCHPKAQKIPKSDKLRDWYQKMIRKALKGKIVMEQTNLYDHFFVHTSESKEKITAARLPYFDSDFWPGEADRILQGCNGNVPEKKAKKAEAVMQRALRAARRDALFIENEKDVLLMKNLGGTIRSMKDDFFVLFMYHTCKHCCQPIISGEQWVCNTCKNFQLCPRCHITEEKLPNYDRHPINARLKHSFHMVELESTLSDTADEDETRSSEIFNSRLEFLNFCQGNHYQFDTLRRAKHSTMMILDYLHNPALSVSAASPRFAMEDDIRGQNFGALPIGQRDSESHAEHNAQCSLPLSKELQNQEISILMDALLHSSKCSSSSCTYRHCRRLKAVFQHGVNCNIRQKGGCNLCKKMWCIILMHARSCTKLVCSVPRCKDIREGILHNKDSWEQKADNSQCRS